MLKLGSAAWANNSFGPTLMQAITAAGLTTNLQVCLDAGDPASYPGSGTKWLDVSGNGYDFFLGTDGTTSAPTFVGVGRQSYWSFNGSTFFRYDTTNETWMQNLHKNNAIYSCVAFSYTIAGFNIIYGDMQDNQANIGADFYSGTRPAIGVVRGGGNALAVSGDTSLTSGAWHMLGCSLNEATGSGGGFFYSDGAYNQVSSSDTFNSTYTSPSASNATYTFEIGGWGNGGGSGNGGRMSCVAIWGGTAITKANMDTLWASMRSRFSL